MKGYLPPIAPPMQPNPCPCLELRAAPGRRWSISRILLLHLPSKSFASGRNLLLTSTNFDGVGSQGLSPWEALSAFLFG